MSVSKIFKITLHGEYAEDYKDTHSDFWIEDFFQKNDANWEVEALPARPAQCECKDGVRGRLCADYHDSGQRDATAKDLLKLSEKHGEMNLEEEQEPQKSAELSPEEIAVEIVPVIHIGGIDQEPVSRTLMRNQVADAIRAERERK